MAGVRFTGIWTGFFVIGLGIGIDSFFKGQWAGVVFGFALAGAVVYRFMVR